MTLTKAKLATRLQTQIGMTKPESLEYVDRLFELIKSTLADGEDLLISGFGKFSVRQKKERLGRNPQTKEKLMLRARKVVTFRASGVLRERVINGKEDFLSYMNIPWIGHLTQASEPTISNAPFIFTYFLLPSF
jgi:integration host factor subunit alpha